MKFKWEVILDPEDPRDPKVVYVILDWHPFTYAITLKAMIDGKERHIRRWDNIRKPDHVDIFYMSGRIEKHRRPALTPIENLQDLRELGDHIAKRYGYYIKETANG